MDALTVWPSARVSGRLGVPGDKSISHRALIFGGLASGVTRIRGLLEAEDVGRTRSACAAAGAEILAGGDALGGYVEVRGVGSRGWLENAGDIDCGNSGTTARLLLGALAGRTGVRLHGDPSLTRRPMGRVRAPLEAMGARFEGGATLPLRFLPGRLHGVDWTARVASAQVKSAVLLAALAAEGQSTYRENTATRDHSERLLVAMGASLGARSLPEGGSVLSMQPGPLEAVGLTVPGDLSSAAFLLAAAALVPGGDVTVDGVGLNPTRTGFLDALAAMGAKVSTELWDGFEPWGSVRVQAAELRGISVGGAQIPRMIDELPLLAVLAAFAEGATHILDAGELRVKESDRIGSVGAGLRAMGASVEERPDGIDVEGRLGLGLREATVTSGGDHRVSMAFAIAGLRTGMRLEDVGCIRTSYPRFARDLSAIGGLISPG